MPKTNGSSKPNSSCAGRPLSSEARENQLIALAYDLLEQRLRDGTATSQEVTTLIKYGSTRGKLEKQILEEDRKLRRAKTDAIESQKEMKALYLEAIDAMKRYSGHEEEVFDEEDVY